MCPFLQILNFLNENLDFNTADPTPPLCSSPIFTTFKASINIWKPQRLNQLPNILLDSNYHTKEETTKSNNYFSSSLKYNSYENLNFQYNQLFWHTINIKSRIPKS